MSFVDDEGFEPVEPPIGGPHKAGDVVAERYRLDRVLGEGGMGWLWAAHDEQLDVDVAIKLLRTDVELDAGPERLLNEARAAARIEHPSIVTILDVGKTLTGDPFIAMELLEGRDLCQLFAEQGPLSVEEAVALLLPVVEALAVAHDQGVIHRDLKPDNVFLVPTHGGTQPKVIDFGIARNTRGVHGSITQAGVAMGSPDYMSPEQASGKRDIDGRADIWAVCVVLYEAVCGSVPFADRPYNALLRAIIEDVVPPLAEHGVDDPALQAVLDRGFKKSREERWPSMRELGKALAALLMDRGVLEDAAGNSLRAAWLEPRSSMISLESISAQTFRSAPPAASSGVDTVINGAQVERRRSRAPLFGALGLLVVAATVGALLMRRSGPPSSPGEVRHSAPAAYAMPATAPSPVEAPVREPSHDAAPEAPPAGSTSVDAPPAPEPAARRRVPAATARPRPAASAPDRQPPVAPPDDLGF